MNRACLHSFGRRVSFDRDNHADKRAVGAIHADSIGHEIEFCPVLARSDAAVRLIPIQDDVAIGTPAD